MLAGPDWIPKLTGRPEVAVAPTVKSGSPKVLPVRGAKLMVWSALLTTWFRMLETLGAEALSPSYDTVRPWVVTLSVLMLKIALPAGSSVLLPIALLPSYSVTMPVGVVDPA